MFWFMKIKQKQLQEFNSFEPRQQALAHLG